MRPKHLAIALSQLIPHPCSSVALEQYATEGDLAAYWMLAVDELDQTTGKVVADLGAGNGILGIACLLLGAQHVHFVECDEQTVKVLELNLATLDPPLRQRCTVHHHAVGQGELELTAVDLIVMNPPWGVQIAKADRPFLNVAFGSEAQAIHVLHSDQATHLTALATDLGWESEAVLRTDFRLPPTYAHHAQRKGTTGVQCWRFHRPGDARLPTEND
jgi:putative methylase